VIHQVGGELQADDAIDADAGALDQVEQPAGEHVVEDALQRVPAEGDRHDVGVVTVRAQGVAQPIGQNLGPPRTNGTCTVAMSSRMGSSSSRLRRSP